MRIVWGLVLISFLPIATILKSFCFTKILMHFKYKIMKNCDSKSIRYLDCRRQCALVTGISLHLHTFHILLLTWFIPYFNLHVNHPTEKITDNQKIWCAFFYLMALLWYPSCCVFACILFENNWILKTISSSITTDDDSL